MSMVSVSEALQAGVSPGTVQTCAGALSCVWHLQIARSPHGGDHILQLQHRGALGLAGMGMVNDVTGQFWVGLPLPALLAGMP